MGPDPAVAAVRSAVRESLADVDPGAVVLVACSGGADSMALAAATAFEATRAGWRVAGVTVDHGLQAGSSERAAAVTARLRTLGLDPVEVASVSVRGDGGPEAAARRARYAALDEVACRLGASAVLLGHTRDDQAETVLLGLARGSGARSLAGMPRHARADGLYRRPLLGLVRTVTRTACAAEDLGIWDDPHNADPAYTRARVRHRVLPVLEAELGPGVAAALARTADLLRDDADALDAWADRAYAECVARPSGDSFRDGADAVPDGSAHTGDGGMSGSGSNGEDGRSGGADSIRPVALWVNRLQAVPPAVRRRVIRRAALWAGSPPTDLTAGHVAAADALVSAWRGQAWVDLPGGVNARRVGDQLFLAAGTGPD